MQTVLLHGVPVEITDAGAAAVVKLKAELVGAVAEVAAKDGEIDAIKRLHATELVSSISLFDGLLITAIDGLPTSASRLL